LRIDLHIHAGNAQLDRIEALVRSIAQSEATMAGELAGLQAQVAANTDVIESAITLIQGIKAALDAAIASGDPAALAALSATLSSEDEKLAAAVAANTPAPPTP